VSSSGFDPERARAAVRRGLRGAPVQLADSFARIVRNAPQERIEQVMATPARRVVVAGIFWQLPQHVSRRQAAGTDATIRWEITGPAGAVDVFDLQIADGRCRVHRGGSEAEPRVTITLDGAEFLRLATGNADPMQDYFSGKIKLKGDIMLAAKLQSLFRVPKRPPAAASLRGG
jgi:putative sterol carrier protein